MGATTLLSRCGLRVDDYRCSCGPGDPSSPELHRDCSVSWVRRGSFGCEVRGVRHELVAGSVMVGCDGDEFTCTHDHVGGGDECLAFHLGEELVDNLGGRRAKAWTVGSLPPLPELMVLGELAQAAADGRSDVGVDEAGLVFAARVVEVAGGSSPRRPPASARDRRRAVESAVWIDEHAHEPLDLERIAAEASASPFHFLRSFSSTLGVSPHQYLVRTRLRRAARLLADTDMAITDVALEVGFADLSNFVRTFGRAAGRSPARFRRAWRSGSVASELPPRG